MSRLLLVGLLGWAATFALSTPGNPVVDLTLRRHQLAGMLVSHLSVAAVIAVAIVVSWIGPRAIVAEIAFARSLVTPPPAARLKLASLVQRSAMTQSTSEFASARPAR